MHTVCKLFVQTQHHFLHCDIRKLRNQLLQNLSIHARFLTLGFFLLIQIVEWAHRRSAYAQLSHLYLLSHSMSLMQ